MTGCRFDRQLLSEVLQSVSIAMVTKSHSVILQIAKLTAGHNME
jgi:hypothetical protein